MWRLLLALLSVDGGAPAAVQLHASGNQLELTWHGQRQTLRFDQAPPDDALVAHALLLASIDRATVDAVVEKGKAAWVVLDVTGPSRPPESAGRFCGAGVEHAKVLVRLGGPPAPPDVVLVDSCFASIESRSAEGALAGLRAFRHTRGPDGGDRLDDVTLRLDFDVKKPEAGFRLTTVRVESAP